jgi:hypothetical protein
MREQVEFGPRSVLGAGPVGTGSPSLRLLLPWIPDEAAPGAGGRSWPDGPTRWVGNRRRLAIVDTVERELARPSAMVVMQQILEAWRSAERQLASSVDGSLERSRVQGQVATLRSLYQGLFVQVRHAQTNEPRPEAGEPNGGPTPELGRTLDFVNVPEREKGEVLAAFAAHKDEVSEGSLARA